ncbi:MAG: aminotransferase class V-fold PLP-dependent enzyme, partial [Planctomycetes bacterium]|nr:aminotransferase class V-fold PLP-dependent enzyme [Planctomycetota bacterium]
MAVSFDVARLREQFPALRRRVAGRPAVFFDGPAGSQVPSRVADAVHRSLISTNANHGGHFATARESDAILADAHRSVADFLGTSDPDCVIFGANMTSLTFS